MARVADRERRLPGGLRGGKRDYRADVRGEGAGTTGPARVDRLVREAQMTAWIAQEQLCYPAHVVGGSHEEGRRFGPLLPLLGRQGGLGPAAGAARGARRAGMYGTRAWRISLTVIFAALQKSEDEPDPGLNRFVRIILYACKNAWRPTRQYPA